MLITLNKLVACTPFAKLTAAPSEKKGGLHMADLKIKLQELNVVMFTEVWTDHDKALAPGTKVFVRGDAVTQNWAKEVWVQDGVEFILVPLAAIQYIITPTETTPWQSGC